VTTGTTARTRTAELRPPSGPESQASLGSRVVGAPATWLVLFVGLSTFVRAWIGVRVASPWILPDEVVYSELAKSIAEGSRPSIRGVPAFGWGEIYPTVISPAWMLVEDPLRAYHVALAINGLVMSLAAIPAYFLARMFVSQRSAILVAGMTVLVPSLSYTGAVMTENAFYPVFLSALLLMARSLRSPSLGNQALALGGFGLVAFTRIQGIALVAAYLAAILLHALCGERAESKRVLRRFVPTAVVVGMVSLAPALLSLARGEGALGWLGARSGTFDAFRPQEIPQWFVFLAGGLVLYVAVAPAIATAVVAVMGLSRRAPARARLFAALAVPTLVAMLGSVAVVSASLDVDGMENLNERYVFYVVPLLVLGLALWIEEGLARPWHWAWIVVLLCCLLPAAVPIDSFRHNAGFQSVALLPWLGLSLAGLALAVCVGAFAAACAAIWATCRRETAGRLWLLVGTTFAFVGLVTYFSNSESATNSASAFADQSASWVDDAVPDGAEVSVLWDSRVEGASSVGETTSWLMVTEMLNTSVAEVHRVGPATYYEVFLPTVPVSLGEDGRVIGDDGAPFRPRYLLVTCRTNVAGRVVARAPRGLLRLLEVDGPVRLGASRSCE